MDIDLKSLYEVVDQLNLQQRAQLLDYLASGQRIEEPSQDSVGEWQFNLARGEIITSPDFDDPLPEEFWLGEV